MKPLFVFLIIVAFAISGFGQTQSAGPAKCSLTLAQSPAIRGLKLGMSVEEVLRQFPGASEEPHIRQALSSADQEFGVARFSSPSLRSEPKFAGINGFSFEFLDRHLSSLWVQYAGPEWKTVDDFISRLSGPFNLPGPNSWEPDASDQKTLKCVGFEVKVSAGPSAINSVWLRNPAVLQIVKERREEAKEKARNAFKP